MSDTGEIVKRCVKVNAVIDRTVKAFCHLRKASRTFKIDNISPGFSVIRGGEMDGANEYGTEESF
ncbi:hypothetical protein [Bacillus solimangrovi]|uniref:hypothetical protein n=1 Tax=Bacillus solimangrovi TaxID=1305675 RepID=UPI001112D0DA|nr:hypothetical protein [Bacillus solimangrovi]